MTQPNLRHVETARAIAQAFDVSLYRDPQRIRPTLSAQEELASRTHYVDDATLRFHKSRILGAAPLFGGLFFRIVESCALDMHNTRRGFRCVLFDLDGEVVYRPKLEETSKNANAADEGFWDWVGTFDPLEYYRVKLTKKGARLLRQAHEMQALADTLSAATEEADA